MDKILTYRMADALRKKRPLCLLVEIDHPKELFRAWTGVGMLDYDGIISNSPYSIWFDRYAVGLQPADWLQMWNFGLGQSWLVQEDATSLLGYKMRAVRTSAGSRDGLAYGGLIQEISDGEVLARIRPASSADATYPALTVRGSNNNASTCYLLRFESVAGVKKLVLLRSVNNAGVGLVDVPYEWSTTKYSYLRLRFQDNHLQGKAWLEDQPEPTTWQLDYTVPTGGLLAEYFNNTTLTGATAYFAIENPNFTFPSDNTTPPRPGVNPTNYSARWRGRVISPLTGVLTLGISVDDGGRLYVDGVLKIDKWFNQAETLYTVDITVQAGQKLEVVFEYYEGSGGAAARLLWAYNGSAIGGIPDGNLEQYTIPFGWVGLSQVSPNAPGDIDFFSIALGTDTARMPIQGQWKGLGVLGNITPVGAVNDLSIQEVNLSLSGVSAESLDFLEQAVRNRLARAWLAAIDVDGSIVRDPFQLLDCEMDTIGLKVSEEGLATVNIIARSGFYSLERAVNDVWSDRDQQRRFPGDTGMKYIAELQNQDVIWTA